MGVVLLVALGIAALQHASATVAGVTFLLTFSVLTLAVVGVFCGRKSHRAWWLGFALFGWGYLGLWFWSSEPLRDLRTMKLLEVVRSATKPPPPLHFAAAPLAWAVVPVGSVVAGSA
jgi:hypothetical protein